LEVCPLLPPPPLVQKFYQQENQCPKKIFREKRHRRGKTEEDAMRVKMKTRGCYSVTASTTAIQGRAKKHRALENDEKVGRSSGEAYSK